MEAARAQARSGTLLGITAGHPSHRTQLVTKEEAAPVRDAPALAVVLTALTRAVLTGATWKPQSEAFTQSRPREISCNP